MSDLSETSATCNEKRVEQRARGGVNINKENSD